MNDFKEKIAVGGITAIVVMVAFLVLLPFLLIILGLSWIVTCGIIKLITVCFGLEFSWTVATGIWLIMFLLKGLFSKIINIRVKE